jgi:hypothetical protein
MKFQGPGLAGGARELSSRGGGGGSGGGGSGQPDYESSG